MHGMLGATQVFVSPPLKPLPGGLSLKRLLIVTIMACGTTACAYSQKNVDNIGKEIDRGEYGYAAWRATVGVFVSGVVDVVSLGGALSPEEASTAWSGGAEQVTTPTAWTPPSESASTVDPMQEYPLKTQPPQETAYASNSPQKSSSPEACEPYIIFPAETVNTGLRGSYRPVINPARFDVNMAVVNNPAELKKRVSAFQKFYADNDQWDLHHLNVIEDVDEENSMYRDLSASWPYGTPEVFTEKHAAEPGKSAMSIKPFLDNARCWAGMSAGRETITKSDKKDWSDYPAAKTAVSCLREDKSDSSLLKNACTDSIQVYSCTENDDYNSCSAQGRRAWEEWRSDIGLPKGWGIVTSHRIHPGESFVKEDQVAACPRGTTIAVQFSLSHEQQKHRCIMVPGHREED
ncbi:MULTISPECIES: hypothetical protein [Pseudomonas]|uniref:hypothetical protein n=1 Tax=Pseudomonas TaxID=286 RepID=UPI00117999BB|nr:MULTISPECIES: hypothetical protein [Pseudomonas]